MLNLFLLILLTALSGPAFAGPYEQALVAGNQLVQDKKFDEAIAKYNEAIQLNPKDWTAYNQLSIVYSYQNRLDDAILGANQAIALAPRGSLATVNRGFYYQTQKKYALAIEDYTLALKTKETHDVYTNRGLSYYQLGRYSEALDDFKKASGMQNAVPTDWGWRGDAEFALGKYPEAIADYERDAPSDLDSVLRRAHLGMAYLKTGQKDKARATADQLVELDPRLAPYFGGEHALELYDLDMRRKIAQEAVAAAESAEAAGQMNKAFEAWLLARGHAMGYTPEDLALGGKIQKGILRVYAQLPVPPELPEQARRYKIQAGAAARDHDLKQAILLYNKAIAVAPWDPECHFNNALLLGEEKEYPQAIQYMKNYLLLAPHAPDARAAQDKIYAWGG